jgi:hypothetical protein
MQKRKNFDRDLTDYFNRVSSSSSQFIQTKLQGHRLKN